VLYRLTERAGKRKKGLSELGLTRGRRQKEKKKNRKEVHFALTLLFLAEEGKRKEKKVIASLESTGKREGERLKREGKKGKRNGPLNSVLQRIPSRISIIKKREKKEKKLASQARDEKKKKRGKPLRLRVYPTYPFKLMKGGKEKKRGGKKKNGGRTGPNLKREKNKGRGEKKKKKRKESGMIPIGDFSEIPKRTEREKGKGKKEEEEKPRVKLQKKGRQRGEKREKEENRDHPGSLQFSLSASRERGKKKRGFRLAASRKGGRKGKGGKEGGKENPVCLDMCDTANFLNGWKGGEKKRGRAS